MKKNQLAKVALLTLSIGLLVTTKSVQADTNIEATQGLDFYNDEVVEESYLDSDLVSEETPSAVDLNKNMASTDDALLNNSDDANNPIFSVNNDSQDELGKVEDRTGSTGESETQIEESSSLDNNQGELTSDTVSSESEASKADDNEELNPKLDPDSNIVSLDNYDNRAGLERSSRSRSARAAGGWQRIDGAIYYIDPSSGKPLSDGVKFVDSIPYLFNEKGQLISGWYTNSKGDKSYAKNNGVAYVKGGYTLDDGIRYVMDENGVLAKGKWVDEPGYGRYYGDPNTGAAYINGGFTVSGGIRYVFNRYGLLAKGEWVDEPGYGRYYGDPNTGAAYINGGFTVSDGIRYVFDMYGLLAKGKWVDEPGYGRYYGDPNTGAAYINGGFTVSDGIRYVFNRYGLLAKGQWVDEPGYGRYYGDPNTGAAYISGGFTVSDGMRYVFNMYGLLAKGEWVDEPGYGRYYGKPDTGEACMGDIFRVLDGKDYVFDPYGLLAVNRWVHVDKKGYAFGENGTGLALKDGMKTVRGKKHIFNEKGYTHEGWYYDNDGGFCFGLGEMGEAVINKKIKLNNRIYNIGSNGFWTDRKQLSQAQLNSLKYVEENNKLYLMVDNAKLDTPAVINGTLISVKPGTFEVASPLGWHWYGNKEFYFTDKVSIAKPYAKVGAYYVNGAYGGKIKAEAKGIDVSSHNSNIDWNKVRKDDVEFAFIRAAYTTYTDRNFETNIQKAREAGVKTGVYIYSMAKNTADAEKEADYIINLLKKHKIDLPVAFDIEDAEVLRDTASNRARTDIINAFANKIQKAGYKVAVYSNLNWLNNYLDKNELVSKYDIWLAHWHSKPGLSSKYWQASETGKVDGINTNVDINFAFSKLP